MTYIFSPVAASQFIISSFSFIFLTNDTFYEFQNHPGGSIFTAFAESFAPLYFTVTQLKEVMSTEQPCDLAYEFGDGLYDIKELPLGFPKPGWGYFIPFTQG